MKRVVKVFLSILFILVLTISSILAMTVTINLPEKYSQVNAGEKVYFETEIKWPENTGRKDLRLEYSIQDEEENIIAYLKVLKAIETQASFMDSISIPESTKPGTYSILLNIADYSELNQKVAASFKISNKIQDPFSLYLFVGLGIVGVIGIIVAIELAVLIKKKDKGVK